MEDRDDPWDAGETRLGFLQQEVAELTPGRAIDLACGQGRNAVWLAECGWEVTGVDFSAVERTGLRIERAETVRRPVDTSEGEGVALDALVRARR